MKAQEDSRHLVGRAKAGDREAFDLLILRYRTHLESVIRARLGERLRKLLGVEDVLQETLLRAFRSMDRFEWKDHGSFFRWLCGIAVKVILEAANSRKQGGYIALDFEVNSPEASPSKTIQRQERSERFQAAIRSLSPDYQTVLRLVRLEGLSVTEAARRMNRSPNAVSHLLLRALRKLREVFGDTESFYLSENMDREGGEGHG